ncbi:MAG TPA: hypothetical protein PLO44_00095 [Candidatus Paceibacterota bacterium]|nr:hypothetical protein [Candidatus Paceibacterota bacterium]
MNTKPVILVVEDEMPLLQAIKIKLEKNNFDVVTARTIEQAINYVQDLDRIDGVWLDHYLLGKKMVWTSLFGVNKKIIINVEISRFLSFLTQLPQTKLILI